MKEILFKKLFIQNFISIGDEPIEIEFSPGIHIITGSNLDKADSKNGVGKSTILDALFFGVFGETIRPIKKEGIINWVTKKEGRVSVYFDITENGKKDEFTIHRTINPSRVQMIKNGEDISRTVSKTKEEIYEILNTTPEMFSQSVVMCINDTEPFLSKTPAVKRKFIEDIFQIEIFGKMSKYINNDYKEVKQLFDKETEKLEDCIYNINIQEKQYQEYLDRKNKNLQVLIDRKESIEKDIKEVGDQLIDIDKRIDRNTLNSLQDKIRKINDIENNLRKKDRELNNRNTEIKTKISFLQKEIESIKKVSSGFCVYCKQPFSESNIEEKKKLIAEKTDNVKKYNTEIDKSEKELSENKINFRHIDDKRDEINELIKKENIIISEQRVLASKRDLLKNQLDLVDKDIYNINNEKNSYGEVLLNLNTKKENIGNIIKEYEDKIKIINISKLVVSSEGVKNIIIKKLLRLLNGRLNFYLNSLDSPCSCQFNEYFDETIKNNSGRECSYFNFSGGERKRIDLAMLFTFMDIKKLQSGISTNISLYDELLDNALDNIGIENTLNILRERVDINNEAIYIISHKNEAIKHATSDIIYLEKKNGVTTRKKYEQFI